METEVTVVTLTYKKFGLLYETLGSVLEQDYPAIELIISDDGSENFPKNEIIHYLETNAKSNIRWKILTAEHNQGTVKNLNKAYRQASGKYIINLSAGDMFCTSDAVSRLTAEMEDRGCELLVTRRMLCTEKGEFLGYLPKEKNLRKIAKLTTPSLQHRAFITGEFFDMASGSALCIRTDAIQAMGYYDERYILWEDGPLFTRYTKHSLLATDYDIISVKYTLGGVSNSGSNPLMTADYMLYNATDRCADIENYDRLTQMRVNYFKARDAADTLFKRLLLYLRHPLVMLVKIWYKLTAH